MKVKDSWSKPYGLPGLIGRKQVDWTIFQEGTKIPSEFHEDFDYANDGKIVGRDQKVKIILEIEGKQYTAFLKKWRRKDISVDTFEILYRSNRELRKLLRTSLEISYKYIEEARASEEYKDKKKKNVISPQQLAEYLDFYETGEPFRYRVEIISHRS